MHSIPSEMDKLATLAIGRIISQISKGKDEII